MFLFKPLFKNNSFLLQRTYIYCTVFSFANTAVNYTLALATGICHVQGLTHVLLQLLIFSNPWKWRAMRHSALGPGPGETGRTDLQIDTSRRQLYEPTSCISSHPGWLLLMTSSSWPSWDLAETFCKTCVLDCIYSSFTKNHIYTNLSPELFGSVSQSSLWAVAPISLLGKLNLQLSLCAFFWVNTTEQREANINQQ